MTPQHDPAPATEAPTSADPAAASSPPAPKAPAAWPIVMMREIVARLTDRNFLISTGVTLAIIVGAMAVQGFLASRGSTSVVAVTDPAASQLAAAAAASPGEDATGFDTIETRSYPDAATARRAVVDGDADAWLHREGDSWVLSGAEETPGGSLRGRLEPVVRDRVLATNARAAGTTVAALEKGTELRVDALDAAADPAAEVTRTVVQYVFAFLFYFASLMFGMAIATSVVEEKQSRIVEILATAIPVRQLLLGKVLGNAVLAFGQMILFVGVGLVGMSFTPLKAGIPALAGPSAWFLVFFVVGFLALACVWAAAGALASRNEDLQATTTPMTMLVMIVFFTALWATGVGRVIASYVPIASSITMPARLLEGTAQWWEPVLSLGITLAFAAFMIGLGERIYRRALLQTQGRVTIRQALRTAD